MDFYTPIFSKITDSSLWAEPDYVVKVFLTMLAKKDRDFIVRGNTYNIALWARKADNQEEVIKALKILSSPDTRRLEPQTFDGRRIEKVEEGWLILNGKAYQDLMTKTNRRVNNAKKQQRYRDKGMPLKGEAEYDAAAKSGASQESLDAISTRNLPQ